ncbi:DUF6035 family protein [Mesorhizobium sp.]|uniref:DUF6035 family protein n=1 Tax=Mesorhizobium sp. TaxID=1871066 RepID=UPI003563C5BC
MSDVVQRSGFRVEAFKAFHRQAEPVFGCPACPGHLYPKLSLNHRAYWAHIAADGCPLAEGRRLSERQLDALLYRGRQEGAAHEALVAAVANMAQADSSVDQGSISIGSYLASSVPGWHGRYPDVRFAFDGGRIAIEVQLSPISLHRLAERALYYQEHGYTLVWVTRDFDPRTFKPTWLWDVWATQRAAVFSIDDAVLQQSVGEGRFLLKRHSIEGGAVTIVGLRELVPVIWHVEFKRRWREAARENWGGALDLTREVLAQRGIPPHVAEPSAVCHAINTLIAIESWEPIGSRHSNPRALINDFLNSADAMLAHRIIFSALRIYRPETLDTGKTKEMISKAAQRAKAEDVAPWNSTSAMAAIAHDLFPAWSRALSAG